jgi:hydroxymethylpyrimidine/phosphomethylpyrimidine kinase
MNETQAESSPHVVAALSIAGSDSGGGAGIQADLRTFLAFGLLGTTAITAVTAQNTRGVDAWEPVPVALVAAQIRSVLGDLPVRAIKTGMLGTAEVIEAIAETLRVTGAGLPLVVDPVMVATSGHRLLRPEAEAALVAKLLPMARVVTPNRPEAAVLSGLPADADAAAHAAAIRLHAPEAWIVIKGGHGGGDTSVDHIVGPDGESFDMQLPRIATRSTHGTGCTLSAAITAGLALGWTPALAIRRARRFVHEAIAHATPVGGGHGPLAHLFALQAGIDAVRDLEPA